MSDGGRRKVNFERAQGALTRSEAFLIMTRINRLNRAIVSAIYDSAPNPRVMAHLDPTIDLQNQIEALLEDLVYGEDGTFMALIDTYP